jgi:diguanylate cyclase (GGDEF)-like protein/PAS domain S-box-containing protein
MGKTGEPRRARAEQEFLAAVFDTVDALIAVLDGDGRIIRFNRACERLTGQRAVDVTGAPVWDVLLAGDRGVAVRDAFTGRRSKESPMRLEHDCRARSGELRLISWSNTVLIDSGGAVSHIVATGLDITAQRTCEEERDHSESRHRALVEQAADIVAVIDASGTLTYASPAAERLLGWELDEWLGRPALDLVADEDLPEVAESLANTLSGPGVKVPLEFRVRAADGRLVDVEAIANNRLADPAVAGVVINLRDVTERRQAAAALRVSEQRYRSLTTAAHDAIVTIGGDGRIASWNRGAQNIFGWDPDEVLGRPLAVIIPPRLRPAHDRGLARVVAGGASVLEGTVIELDGLHRDGHEVAIELSLSRWEQGGAPFFTGILRDVTERKVRDGLLCEAEERFRSAFDFAPIGMALIGLDGRFLRVNDALCGIVGYSTEDLMARTFQDITHWDDLAADMSNADRMLSGEISSYRMEKRYIRADGRVVWVTLSVSLVHGPTGEPRYFVAQIEDITERRVYTDELAYQAHHDDLTGLANRVACLIALDRALARQHRSDVGVLYCDLDGFKRVNDTYGHDVGDLVLRAVSDRLIAAVRPGDLVARLGGDEFVVICELPRDGEATLARIAHRLKSSVDQPLPVDHGEELGLRMSVGTALARSQERAQALLARADRAMYRHKQSRQRPAGPGVSAPEPTVDVSTHASPGLPPSPAGRTGGGGP